MQVHTNIVYIPGPASVDYIEALERAIAKLRPKLNISDTNQKKHSSSSIDKRVELSKRVKRELLDAGITMYGLLKSESRFLPKVLHPNEHIEAIVYGQHHSSSAMLVATNERILFIDKKPMVSFMDEVSYEVVSGLEFEIHTIFATLILHTPVKNYDIHFANLRCAENFARHIEAHRLKREQDTTVQKSTPSEKTVLRRVIDSKNKIKNMAGYFWLPTEEEPQDV